MGSSLYQSYSLASTNTMRKHNNPFWGTIVGVFFFALISLTGCTGTTARVNLECDNIIDNYGEGSDQNLYNECVALNKIQDDLDNHVYRDKQARNNARVLRTRLQDNILNRVILAEHDHLTETMANAGLTRSSYE